MQCHYGISLGGVIDKTGKVLIQPQYYDHYPLSEELARLHVGRVYGRGGKSGYIGKRGKVVIELQFDQATSFPQGLTVVKVGKKWGDRSKPLK